MNQPAEGSELLCAFHAFALGLEFPSNSYTVAPREGAWTRRPKDSLKLGSRDRAIHGRVERALSPLAQRTHVDSVRPGIGQGIGQCRKRDHAHLEQIYLGEI